MKYVIEMSIIDDEGYLHDSLKISNDIELPVPVNKVLELQRGVFDFLRNTPLKRERVNPLSLHAGYFGIKKGSRG